MAQLGPAYVIINPNSAYGKTKERWPALQQALDALPLEYGFAFTEGRGHASLLARQAFDQGARLLVSVGGEGTLFEMVNGLAGPDGRAPLEAAFGLIPSGTGSDLARYLGVPREPTAAIARLAGDAARTLDLGIVECAPFHPAGSRPPEDAAPVHRVFVNVAGVGFDGEVIERVESRPKAGGGTIPYLTNLFVSLVNYRNKPMDITYDGRRLSGTFNSVIAANGAYFGGGMFIAPHADAGDGRFDLILLGDLNKLEVIQNLPRLYKGTHITHPKVTELRAGEIRVEAGVRALVQADGELVGMSPATFRIVPGAVRIKV